MADYTVVVSEVYDLDLERVLGVHVIWRTGEGRVSVDEGIGDGTL